MKRFNPLSPDAASVPPLSGESVAFKKFPRVREFLTHTTYDDGSARAPGRLWIENDGLAFVATLFEPAAFLRAKCRAPSLDDVLALCEAFLGMDAPPWERDTWAAERAVGKKKK